MPRLAIKKTRKNYFKSWKFEINAAKVAKAIGYGLTEEDIIDILRDGRSSSRLLEKILQRSLGVIDTGNSNSKIDGYYFLKDRPVQIRNMTSSSGFNPQPSANKGSKRKTMKLEELLNYFSEVSPGAIWYICDITNGPEIKVIEVEQKFLLHHIKNGKISHVNTNPKKFYTEICGTTNLKFNKP